MRRTSRAAAAVAVAAAATALTLTTPIAAQAGRLLTGQDIKDDSLTSADVANGSLKKKDFAAEAWPADGADGARGLPGVDGADGADGVDGVDGAQGLPGEKGDVGPGGPAGPAGPEGKQGVQGPSGVVDAAFKAGSVDAPTTSLSFLVAPGLVTVREGETVSVVSSAGLGASVGAIDLDLDICVSNGGALTAVAGSGVNNLSAAAGQQHLFTLPALVEGLSGTFSVGLCGRSTDGSSWDLEGGGQTTVQVFTPQP